MKSKSGGSSEQLYCVCRSADTGRFMIGCDHCGDWFHGDCVNISANKSKTIKKFYCPLCREVDPSLIIIFADDKANRGKPENVKQKPSSKCGKKGRMSPPPPPSKKPRLANTRCGQCIGCFKRDDCGKCDQCKCDEMCQLRRCVNAAILHTKSNGKGKKAGSGAPPGGGTRAGATKYKQFLRDAGMYSSDEEITPAGVQCLNPPCIKPARKQSKYCSDECGLALAKTRIETILPGRLNQWNRNVPQAQVNNEKQLKEIKVHSTNVKHKLTDLDEIEQLFDVWVNKVNAYQGKCEDSDDSDDEADDVNIFCVTCGQETSVKTAIKHLNKCFAKYESQVSYGTVARMANPYNMFCDVFNKTNSTYCRRLRALCPEHTKTSKEEEMLICGCPLNWDWNKIESTQKEMCVKQRRYCMRHMQWQRKYKAVIDCQRLAAMLQLEELIENESKITQAIASRGGVLALMLHKTIDHNDPHVKQE